LRPRGSSRSRPPSRPPSATCRSVAAAHRHAPEAGETSAGGHDPGCRTTQQHDAPFQNPPEAPPDEIEVTDPSHPLFGRRFTVVSVSHPPQRPGHVVVAYRDFMRLRIPVPATSLAGEAVARLRTPFTRAALLDLLALLKECEAPCP